MLMKNSTSPSTVNAIAGFADRAVSASLKPDVRKLYMRNILDSLGCAISALPGAPFAALREQFAEYRSGGSCTLHRWRQDGRRTKRRCITPGWVRYVDLLDSYMSPGGLCHPSDNFGAILAAAEHAKASGEDFMLALASPMRSSAGSPPWCRSWQRASIMPFSLQSPRPREQGKLFGLTGEQIAHAISIATVDNISLTLRPLEPSIAVEGLFSRNERACVRSIPRRSPSGVSPVRPDFSRGPNGLLRMFDQKIDVDWSDDSLEIIKSTIMKKFCSLIHGQPVLEVVLKLKPRQ